jgi:hypothetical protein
LLADAEKALAAPLPRRSRRPSAASVTAQRGGGDAKSGA